MALPFRQKSRILLQMEDRDFIMNGRDFRDDSLRISWWQVMDLFLTVKMLTMLLWLNFGVWGERLTIQLW